MQENVNGLIKNLSDALGPRQAARVLAKKAGYIDLPPSIDEFMKDPMYLGNAVSLYPLWKQTLRQVYPDPCGSPALQVSLGGAIGLGKSTVSRVGNAYDMAKLMFLKNPQEFFGLAPTTKLAFAFINQTLNLAGSVLTSEFEDMIQESPFFREHRKKANRKEEFLPNRVVLVTGSRFTHVLGMATIGGILSELNFQNAVRNQAYENHTNAIRRLQSRFEWCFHHRGFYPGRIWLDSSKNDQGSYLEKFLEENRHDKTLLAFQFAYWEMHAHRLKYCGKTFKVFIGDQKRDPFIIEDNVVTALLPEEFMLEVPIEYYDRFKQNLPRALKDIAGRGTWSSSLLIPAVDRINQCFDQPNPVYQDTIELDFDDKSQQLIDYIDWNKYQLDGKGKYIHIDLGLTNDCAGIAITAHHGFVNMDKLNMQTGFSESVSEPIFRTYAVLRIKAAPGKQIPLYKIKLFLHNLVQKGETVAKVSTDGFQSANLRQDLTLAGFTCELLSVDRTLDPYTFLKDLIFENRITGPAHPVLLKECRELETINNKADHPDKGSKDLSDAVCGSAYLARNDSGNAIARQSMDNYMDALDKMLEGDNLYDRIRKGYV